jgi:hypothetical protein
VRVKRISRSGQFIVITALFIGMLTIATAIMLYETQAYQQHFRYRPYQDIMVNLENDLKRALACSLANATITYNRTWTQSGSWTAAGFIDGERNAQLFLNRWKQTAMRAFAGMGVSIDAKNSSSKLVNMTWGSTDCRSRADASLVSNATTLGLFSWKENVTVELRVIVNMSSFESDATSTNMTFKALKEGGQITKDIANDSVKISYYDATIKKWMNTTVNFFAYLGNGIYVVEINKPYVKGLKIMMWVKDSRGIMTVAGLTLP